MEDGADTKTLTGPSSRPPSVHSTASSVTLAAPENDDHQAQASNNTNSTNANPSSANTSQARTKVRLQYFYTKPTGRPPNPDAKPKEKGKVGQLMEKFRHPAVRRSVAMREREVLRAKQTGMHVRTSTAAPRGSAQSFGAWM